MQQPVEARDALQQQESTRNTIQGQNWWVSASRTEPSLVDRADNDWIGC